MIQSFYVTSNGILHGTNIAENGIGGNIFRVDHTSQIQIVNDILVWEAINFGYKFCFCKFLGGK